MVYTDLAFASLFFVLSPGVAWPDQLESVFLLQLGDFSVENFNLMQLFVFGAASIINLILMLNLLISIMGDTFDRVQLG